MNETASSVGADIVCQSEINLSILNLSGFSFTPHLMPNLNHLGDAAGTNGMSFSLQSP